MQLADVVRNNGGAANPRLMRYVEAYLMMARRGDYRPAAPGDGMGHVHLTEEECGDRGRLLREAVKYAKDFDKEEDGCTFNIGCSNFETNRAFVLAIEAARLLAGGGDTHAKRLLKMAVEELQVHLAAPVRKCI